MNSQDMISRLESKGIRPTANRILVMKTLMGEQNPQSLSNLERKMVSMDKSSIFRTLTLFLEHDVVHAFEDGRGVLCYELCEEKRGLRSSRRAHSFLLRIMPAFLLYGGYPYSKFRAARRLLSPLYFLCHQRRMPGLQKETPVKRKVHSALI